MGKVIKFPGHKPLVDKEALKMLKVSDELDAVILRNLSDGNLTPKEMAGLLAHRLGTLMRTLDEKSKLMSVCEEVMKKQAALD